MSSNAPPAVPGSDPGGPTANPEASGSGLFPRLPGITRNVVALGLISLFTDLSSDMIIPVLPLFVTVTLGASAANLGLIEGVAECVASLLRIFSGWLSDRIGRRKPFLAFGYGLSTVAKAAMALSASWTAVLGLRFADRVGKGLRNPPRDALIADSVEPRFFGRAFGFHRALDTVGATLGPLVAFLMLRAFPGDFRRLFAASAIPAVLALLVLALFVRAPRHRVAQRPRATPAGRPPFGPAFGRFLVVAGVFSLASSSLAFLLLHAHRVGFRADQVPLIYLGYNLVYALLSWPIGEISDRVGRRPILLLSYLSFAGVYGLLAWSAAPAVVAGGFVALGIHSALIEGSQRSLVADLVVAERRATAYGLYYTVVGLALLPASAIAGVLWDRFGPRVTFGLEAGLALAAAALFAVLLPAHREFQERHDAQPA